MSTISTQYRFLSANPKSNYRQLFVNGTRIPARALYGWYASEESMTAEEIAADYGISVEAVREAIVYCESNPHELRDDYARQEALMDAMGVNDSDYQGHPKVLSADDRARIRKS